MNNKDKVFLSLIKNRVPALIASEIAGVQPMSDLFCVGVFQGYKCDEEVWYTERPGLSSVFRVCHEWIPEKEMVLLILEDEKVKIRDKVQKISKCDVCECESLPG